MSATLARDALTVETTEYPGWSSFRGVLTNVLNALADARRPEGLVRVGLRYIDEIRLPQPPEDFEGWSGWIDEALTAPLGFIQPQPLSNGTVVLQYGTPPGYVTNFRAAPFTSGRTVQVEGPLRMPLITPEGPYFLLDTDSSWADPDRQIPEFDTRHITAVFDELHSTCIRLFEASITERLRTEVLTRPRDEA